MRLKKYYTVRGTGDRGEIVPQAVLLATTIVLCSAISEADKTGRVWLRAQHALAQLLVAEVEVKSLAVDRNILARGGGLTVRASCERWR